MSKSNFYILSAIFIAAVFISAAFIFTGGIPTGSATHCSGFTTQSTCTSDTTCMWDSVNSSCFANTTTSSGCSTYTTQSTCDADTTCMWDTAYNSCYYKSTTTTSGCSTYTTQSTCTADTTCAWDTAYNSCYYKSTTTGCGTYTTQSTCTTHSECKWDSIYNSCYYSTTTVSCGTGYYLDTDVNYCVANGSAKLKGNITDSSGLAVSGAQVNVHTSDWSTSRGNSSNSNGAYAVADIPPGTYLVDVQPMMGSGLTSPPQISITLSAGQILVKDFILSKATKTITGTVKRASGTAVTDAWVNAWSKETGASAANVKVDTAGSYTLLVGGGSWEVHVYPENQACLLYTSPSPRD